MSGFGRIRHGDGSFMANDIRLDHGKMIKVFGKNGTLMGLPFLVPDREARISDSWKREKSQIGHFHVVSL